LLFCRDLTHLFSVPYAKSNLRGIEELAEIWCSKLCHFLAE
jgi:hypothetical protein